MWVWSYIVRNFLSSSEGTTLLHSVSEWVNARLSDVQHSCVTDVLWMTSWSVGSVGLGAKVVCLKHKCLLTWRPSALLVPLHYTLSVMCECAMDDVQWVPHNCNIMCSKQMWFVRCTQAVFKVWNLATTAAAFTQFLCLSLIFILWNIHCSIDHLYIVPNSIQGSSLQGIS
jgi:hypothetical protein